MHCGLGLVLKVKVGERLIVTFGVSLARSSMFLGGQAQHGASRVAILRVRQLLKVRGFHTGGPTNHNCARIANRAGVQFAQARARLHLRIQLALTGFEAAARCGSDTARGDRALLKRCLHTHSYRNVTDLVVQCYGRWVLINVDRGAGLGHACAARALRHPVVVEVYMVIRLDSGSLSERLVLLNVCSTRLWPFRHNWHISECVRQLLEAKRRLFGATESSNDRFLRI